MTEQLVEFLHHGNTQVRQIGMEKHWTPSICSDTRSAAENLVGYSSAKPTLFKRNQLEPIKDLKLLSKDYEQIAKNALTMLINLTDDSEIVKNLIEDKDFIESLLRRITVRRSPLVHCCFQSRTREDILTFLPVERQGYCC